MKISEIINKNNPSVSFEVFPPKNSDGFASVKTATEEIAKIKPAFMSVTYGAGGGTSDFTVSIAENIQNNFDVTALAHLTCVSSTKETVKKQLEQLKQKGICNILALRGDKPEENDINDYHYASELIRDIKEFDENFCVGGACYPETHPESENSTEDIAHLKEKVDMGLEFLTTQMFFNNNILYNFLYKIREKGITVPVFPGIMPVTNGKQIKRICKLSGTHIPSRFRAIVDKFSDNPKAMQQAGIAYATEQIIDLFANGINNVHVYTMNKPDVAKAIYDNLSEII